ncbi:MAG: hypothetical protein KAG84_02760, partial [Bacteroidales bacterium]|nr:hypothetical protein [Bacteroidales bacterium]
MKYLLFTLLLVFTNYTIFSQNLIINPGAELNPTANGWTQLSGSWVQAQESVKSGATNPQAAHEGDYHFFAGAGAGSLELYQDIDVSGYASAIDAGLQDFAFSGWVRDWSGNDGSNIIVEYRSASSTVLSTYDSGEQIVTSWTEMTDSRTA